LIEREAAAGDDDFGRYHILRSLAARRGPSRAPHSGAITRPDARRPGGPHGTRRRSSVAATANRRMGDAIRR